LNATSPTTAEVASLTEEVQAAIDAGEWETASRLEARRRRALEILLAAELARGAAPDALRDELEALARRTYRLLGEVHHHRDRVEREAATIVVGRKAAREYRQTASE
jgi:hypothetical protein